MDNGALRSTPARQVRRGICRLMRRFGSSKRRRAESVDERGALAVAGAAGHPSDLGPSIRLESLGPRSRPRGGRPSGASGASTPSAPRGASREGSTSGSAEPTPPAGTTRSTSPRCMTSRARRPRFQRLRPPRAQHGPRAANGCVGPAAAEARADGTPPAPRATPPAAAPSAPSRSAD